MNGQSEEDRRSRSEHTAYLVGECRTSLRQGVDELEDLLADVQEDGGPEDGLSPSVEDRLILALAHLTHAASSAREAAV